MQRTARAMIGQLARLVEWFDDAIWGHRWYPLCQWASENYPEDRTGLPVVWLGAPTCPRCRESLARMVFASQVDPRPRCGWCRFDLRGVA